MTHIATLRTHLRTAMVECLTCTPYEADQPTDEQLARWLDGGDAALLDSERFTGWAVHLADAAYLCARAADK